MAEVRVRDPPQSWASWIVVAILTVFIMIVSQVFRNVPIGWIWGVNGWPLHLVYIVIISEALGKVNPKLKMNATQLMCLMIVTTFLYGGMYAWGLPGEKNWTDFMPHYTTSWYIGLQIDEATRATYFNLGFPEWWMHRDVATAEALATGYGTINIGSLIAPMTVSAIMIGSTLMLLAFFTWVFIGPEWVERERLPYPNTIGFSYLIDSATTVETRSEKKTKLFDFGVDETRVFWVSVVLGIIIAAPFYLALVIPEWTSPLGETWGAGEYGLPLQDYIGVPPLTPGGQWQAMLWPQLITILVAVPFEFLLNMFAAWLIMLVIYNYVVVTLGIVPYSPGVEAWAPDIGVDPANPFQYTTFFAQGIIGGIFIWYLWAGRDRLKAIWNAVVTEDVKEHGMSLRLKLLGLGICVVIWFVIWVAIGVPFLVVLMFLLGFIMMQMATARVMGEASAIDVYACTEFDGNFAQWFGGWGYSPPLSRSTLAFGVMDFQHTFCWSWPNGSGGLRNLSSLYRCAYDTKANISDILKYLLIFAVVGVPAYMIWEIYLAAHLGWNNFGLTADATATTSAADSIDRALGIMDPADNTWAMWTTAGTAFTVITLYLRSVFPWFYFHPVAWAIIITSGDRMWLCVALAIPIKYLLFKMLGPRRTAKFLRPIISGIVTGSMIPQIFISLWVLNTAGAANLAANWH